MAVVDTGRLGGALGLNVSFDENKTPDPLRGVFSQGIRKTGQDIGNYLDDREREKEYANWKERGRGALENPQFMLATDPSNPYQLLPEQSVQAEAQQQAEQQKAVQNEQKKAPDIDSFGAPAQKLAVVNAQANGEVDDEPPTLPSRSQIQTKEIDVEGKQLLFREVAHPNWYEDDSFYEGLLSFGLNMLSGNDWAQSFNAGAQVYQNSKGLEERQIWAQDLIAAGYDAHEVQAYVKTGDHKVLTDPREKQMREMEFQMAKLNLGKAQYENDPAVLEAKDRLAEWERKQDWIDRKQERADKATRLNLALRSDDRAEREFAYKRKKDAAEAAAAEAAASEGGDIKNVAEQRNLFISGALQSGLDYKDLENAMYDGGAIDWLKSAAIAVGPESYADQAEKMLMPEFKKHKQVGNQVTEMIGRGLSGGALSETKERPTWFNAIMPMKTDTPSERKRKKAAYDSLKVYANTRAKGKAGNLELDDVNAVATGRLQFMVDEFGIPRALANSKGQIYKYL